MQAFKAAASLDWNGWLRGIVGAFISGGAASIASGTAATWLDKGHDINIGDLMGLTFLISGIISLAKYLETTPVPKPWDGTDRRSQS